MAYIGWARVSSEAQCLDSQIEMLERKGCEKIFAGKHSGKGYGKNIEKLDELIGYVRENDVVVVTKLDRLGRSLKEVLQTVDALKDKGVALEVLEQGINTANNDAMGNAMLQLIGIFAEIERSFIVERTRAGKERTGNFGGRKKKVTDKERLDIREAVANGTTQYAMAKRYGVTQTTIHRIVNEK